MLTKYLKLIYYRFRPRSTQEVFDIVTTGLIAQGTPSLNHNGICAYRGKNNTKCTVGLLITDEEYKPEMENATVSHLHTSNLLPTRLDKHLDLLSQLQRIHDDGRFTPKDLLIPSWKEAFAKVASNYNLVYNLN